MIEAYQTILVSRHVDADHLLETEVPLQIRLDEGGNEASTRSVDVNRAINVLLDKQIVDSLHILVLSRVGCTNNGADTDGVLVHQVHSFLWVDDISVRGTVDVSLLDIEVASRLLPADLDSRVHDDVRLREVLALRLTLVLPALLHGERAEHDGLGGANAGGAHGVVVVRVSGDVEHASNHVDAAVLDVGGDGVFLVVDEVLGEGFGHELFGLSFLE